MAGWRDDLLQQIHKAMLHDQEATRLRQNQHRAQIFQLKLGLLLKPKTNLIGIKFKEQQFRQYRSNRNIEQK